MFKMYVSHKENEALVRFLGQYYHFEAASAPKPDFRDKLTAGSLTRFSASCDRLALHTFVKMKNSGDMKRIQF